MKGTFEETGILQRVTEEKRYSNAIINIAKYIWWVDESRRILDVADELQRWPAIPVLGVLDPFKRIVGILERERLFALIGKPFGREVLQRGTVKEIATHVPPLDCRSNIFNVAQQIRDRTVLEPEFNLIPLITEEGRFQGIFSIQDLNEHLSQMIQDDIQLAGKLQERMLSNSVIAVKDVTIRAWTRAAKGVGGDFFFIKELQGGKIFAALCDVSGKGIAASLVVSMVWGVLSTYDFKRGLKELIKNLNTALVTTFHMEKYLTGIFFLIEPESKKVIFADMGHSHAVLSRNGKIIPLKAHNLNLPIGIDLEIEPLLSSITLRNRDRIFTYTDGITEQKNGIAEEFGEERLYGIFTYPKDQEDLEKRLIDHFDRFRKAVPQQDDMSLLHFSII